MKVSFLPKLDKDQAGIGAHLHLSLLKVDGVSVPLNVTGDEFSMFKMSEAFQAFTAGILHHYPALCHFMAPHHLSMRRLKPSSFAGPFICWGNDNKETAIRAVIPYKNLVRAQAAQPAASTQQQQLQ